MYARRKIHFCHSMCNLSCVIHSCSYILYQFIERGAEFHCMLEEFLGDKPFDFLLIFSAWIPVAITLIGLFVTNHRELLNLIGGKETP